MPTLHHSNGSPPLPQSIRPEQSRQQPADAQPFEHRFPPLIPLPEQTVVWPTFVARSLRQGCYLVQYRASGTSFGRFDGTLRVERQGTTTTASGDLYYSPPQVVWAGAHEHGGFGWFGGFGAPKIVYQSPNPAHGIPILRRNRYRYYLRVTKILEWITFGDSFTLGFERFRFDTATNTFSNEGMFSALMTWTSAPAGYPSESDFLTGTVKDSAGNSVGQLDMGWVSPKYRKATLEIDRVSDSEAPVDNGSGLDWQDVFDEVGWDVSVQESDSDVAEPSGQSWSDAELHAAMLARRDAANLDTAWRYHLLCVRRLDSTSRGIMYDAYGSDSNNVPREGAGISSHWMIPDSAVWGTVAGQRFGAADAPYFRTAVHELGHALGLYHNTVNTGFMNTTGTIAASPGTFPGNVQWAFANDDVKRLRHMPDPWVRPGMIPFGKPYGSAPISPDDGPLEAPGWELEVTPLIDCVPLGAPVRAEVQLTNTSDQPVPVPASLSLKEGHVRGRVIDPAGRVRSFQSLLRCVDEHEVESLEPKEQKRHSMTLLRGAQGALFGVPGMHTIEVEVFMEAQGFEMGTTARATVMVTAPVTASHAAAAKQVLGSPDLLLTLAIGGDHLEHGVSALQAALDDETLRPHFAVVEAKRIGNHFGNRSSQFDKAMEYVVEDTVLSESECDRVTELLERASKGRCDKDAIKRVRGIVSRRVNELKPKSRPQKKNTRKGSSKPVRQ